MYRFADATRCSWYADFVVLFRSDLKPGNKNSHFSLPTLQQRIHRVNKEWKNVFHVQLHVYQMFHFDFVSLPLSMQNNFGCQPFIGRTI